MTSFRFFFMVGLLSLMVAGCACTSEEVTPEPRANGGADDQAQCRVDGDCDSYLRCVDEVCVVPPAITGERDETTPRARLVDQEGHQLAQFYLELALTSDEQSRGLMYRTQMLDEWGMLFVYDDDQHLSFWMKNTLIPLDMIFINSAGEVVGVVHEAVPEDRTPRGVGLPSRYVLEINGGLARELDIDSGATMSLENVDQNLQTRP